MVTSKELGYNCNGIRIVQDFTEDDEGIYLWNADGWKDIEDAEEFVKTLTSMVQEVKDKKKNGK